MTKDFEGWNKRKQEIHLINKILLHFSEGEIWFCTVGINVGFEQDGLGNKFLRPVNIFKKINKNQFLGIPLTRKIRSGNAYFSLSDDRGPSICLLAQIKSFDSKRLAYFSKKINAESFKELKSQFAHLIKIYPRPIHRWDIFGAREQVDPMTSLPQDQDNDPHVYNNPGDSFVN